MARRFFARTAVAQAAIIAVTTALATTNCSPDGPNGGASLSCRQDPTSMSRTGRYGDTEVKMTAVTDSDGSVRSAIRATRGDKLVFNVTQAFTRTGADLDVTFGEMVDGVHHYHLHATTDGQMLTGDVDGKSIVASPGGKDMRLADGSAIPNAVPRDPVVQDEVSRVFAAMGSEAKCGSALPGGVGTTQAAITASEDSEKKCSNCLTACGVALSAIVFTGTLGCMPLVWCPPCYAACWLGFLAVGVVAFANCLNLCDSFVCGGPYCDTGPYKSYRCNVGETCVNPEATSRAGRCCPKDTVGCGPTPATAGLPKKDQQTQCCETLKGETCGVSENRCCVLPETSVDGACCSPDRKFRGSDGAEHCCKAPLCADGACCDGLGVCGTGGGCCASPCGTACCDAGSGESCLRGDSGQKCCSGAQKCGTKCCADGTVCLDPLLETCGVSGCTGGTVATRDEATGGTVCCPSTAFGACNGACCGFGQFCCGSPMACSTSCVK